MLITWPSVELMAHSLAIENVICKICGGYFFIWFFYLVSILSKGICAIFTWFLTMKQINFYSNWMFFVYLLFYARHLHDIFIFLLVYVFSSIDRECCWNFSEIFARKSSQFPVNNLLSCSHNFQVECFLASVLIWFIFIDSLKSYTWIASHLKIHRSK